MKVLFFLTRSLYFSSVLTLETLNISTRLRESVVSGVSARRFYIGTCLHVSPVNFAVFIAYGFTGRPVRPFPWDLAQLTRQLIAIDRKRGPNLTVNRKHYRLFPRKICSAINLAIVNSVSTTDNMRI